MNHAEFKKVSHQLKFFAVDITVDNFESMAKYLGGHVIGTKLPIEKRCIQWWNKCREMEQEASIGEVLVIYLLDSDKVAEIEVYERSFFKVMFNVEGPYENAQH